MLVVGVRGLFGPQALRESQLHYDGSTPLMKIVAESLPVRAIFAADSLYSQNGKVIVSETVECIDILAKSAKMLHRPALSQLVLWSTNLNKHIGVTTAVLQKAQQLGLVVVKAVDKSAEHEMTVVGFDVLVLAENDYTAAKLKMLSAFQPELNTTYLFDPAECGRCSRPADDAAPVMQVKHVGGTSADAPGGYEVVLLDEHGKVIVRYLGGARSPYIRVHNKHVLCAGSRKLAGTCRGRSHM